MSSLLSFSPDKKDEVIDLAMLSNFVHQIVNPLNGVAGTIDNLINGEIEEHRRVQRLGAARAQIEQCINLLRNLAFLSQGFGSNSSSDLDLIVLPKIIIEAAMFFQEEAKNKGITISLSDKYTQNKVNASSDLIRQVLMNIFDNCVKYGERNMPVSVEQRIQKSSGDALIIIRNQSRMPLDLVDIPKLTNLGFRGSNARKVVASGTGLGLYICKHIVEDFHSGSFSINLRKPNDLEFIIKLPNGTA